jgi:hypothetical protein
MLTVLCILGLFALVTAILALANKCDARVPLLLLAIAEMLRCLPLGK